jgi:hypothetical protein
MIAQDENRCVAQKTGGKAPGPQIKKYLLQQMNFSGIS